MPYALLLVSLLVFGFVPKLLTEKINPDAQKIVTLATAARPADKLVAQADISTIRNRNLKSAIDEFLPYNA